MALEWNMNTDEMVLALNFARARGHLRLFAVGFHHQLPVWWQSAPDEAGMQEVLAVRGDRTSLQFSAAVAVAVVNPMHHDETIRTVIAECQPRIGTGPGYFTEAFLPPASRAA